MSAEIREATRADADAIAAMYQETWPIHWHTPECMLRQFDMLDAIGGRALVAAEGERVVGHCEFLPVREPAPSGLWGFLEALEVHRERYRRGVGTALVREAIRRAKALGCTCFGSSPDDERSEGIYRKCGMTRVERSIATQFAIIGEAARPDAELLEELSPAARPWEELLHVLGRFSALPYLWVLAFDRKQRGEEGREKTFAERVRLDEAEVVVFYEGFWLHVLLPPERAADGDLARRAVAYAASRIKALGDESFWTVMPFPLADAVRSVTGIYPTEGRFHFHMSMSLE